MTTQFPILRAEWDAAPTLWEPFVVLAGICALVAAALLFFHVFIVRP